MQKKKEKYVHLIKEFAQNGLLSFLLNFLLAVFVFGYYMLKEKGLFSLSYDFDSQMIPFTKLMLDVIHKNSGVWNWNIDLGSNVVSTMSYYAFGSPFFWIFSWCKGENILYAVGWMYILKYAVAGMTSFYYFKRYTDRKILALTGSVLYTFSGFQTVNLLFFIFHDAVALFPLLLIAFDEMIENDRRGWFAVAVFVNAVTNYYCFIGEAIFLILYYILRYLVDDFRKYIRKMILCIAEGLLGLLMASVVFIPSILGVLRNSRVTDGIPFSHFLSLGRRDLLQCYMTFMYPSEMMMQRSSIYPEDWASRSAYLPLIGIVLVGAYFLKRKKKDWLKRVLAVMMVLMALPVGNGLFSLYTTDYCRWFYMPIIFMVIASIKTMENLKEYRVTFVSVGAILLMAVQYFAFGWWDKNKFELILIEDRFRFITCIGILGVVVLLLICCMKNKTTQTRVLLIAISIYAVMTTSYTCNLYQKFDGNDSIRYKDKIDAISEIKVDDGYRYLTDEDNLSMLGEFPGINSFISTISGSISDFWNSLGLKKTIFSPVDPSGTNELLSVKYIITEQPIENYHLLEKHSRNVAVYYLYEVKDYLNIGYTYDTYMLYDDFVNLPEQNRSIVMLKTLVVSEQDCGRMQGMRRLQVTDVENLTEADIPQLVNEHKTENATQLVVGKDWFTCTINSKKNQYAFFSVPYDRGWQAYVNGKKTEIIKVNGLMAIPLEVGTNQIAFYYSDRLLIFSALMSIVSAAVLILYMFQAKIYFIKNRKGKDFNEQ